LTVGMGWQPLPGTASPPTRLADTLDRVLGRLGAPSRAGIEVVFDRWRDVVGEGMAARTRPVAIDGESLVVACDEPALATHVRFLEAQFVARLTELAGSRQITRIEVRVDRRRRGPRPPRRLPRPG
jgi:hypothetical protein